MKNHLGQNHGFLWFWTLLFEKKRKKNWEKVGTQKSQKSCHFWHLNAEMLHNMPFIFIENTEKVFYFVDWFDLSQQEKSTGS